MKVLVAPSLELDDEMFGLARQALYQYAPDQVDGFTWERFTDRLSWVLVPDVEHPDIDFYKAEMKVKECAPYSQTIKLNVWRTPDLRRDGAPMPHSHPWPFVGHVLMGGYEEDRYDVAHPNGVLDNPLSSWELGAVSVRYGVMHRAGDNNNLSLATFHEVTKVHEPGRTLSLMDCGQGRKDGWGYLDPDTGLYVPKQQSPIDSRFEALWRDRNPHLR